MKKLEPRDDIKAVKWIMAIVGGFLVYPMFGIVPAFLVTFGGCMLYVCCRD